MEEEASSEFQWDGQDEDVLEEEEDVGVPVRGDPEDTVAGGLAQEWASPRHADVKVICQGGISVRTHRLVLAALSPMLEEALLEREASEAEDSAAGECAVLVLAPSVDADDLRIFLSCVYNGGEEPAYVTGDLRHMGFSECPPPVAKRKRRKDVRRGGPEKRKSVTVSAPPEESWEPVTVDVKQEFVEEAGDDSWEWGDDREEQEEELEGTDSAIKITNVRQGEDQDGESHSPAVFRRNRGKRAPIWKYFDQAPDKSSSTCKKCRANVRTKYGNTTGLIQHLRHNHSVEYSAWEEERQELKRRADTWKERPPSPPKWFGTNNDKLRAGEQVDEDDKPLAEKRYKRSVVWKFFRRLDNFTLECVKCLKHITLSQGSCTSGGRNHLKRFHPEAFEEADSTQVIGEEAFPKREEEEKVKPPLQDCPRRAAPAAAAAGGGSGGPRRSVIWSHFSETSETHMSCNWCGQVLARGGGSTSGCLNHLKKMHPEKLAAGGGGRAEDFKVEGGGELVEGASYQMGEDGYLYEEQGLEEGQSWEGGNYDHVDEDFVAEEEVGEEEYQVSPPKRRKRKRTSVVWSLFSKLDDSHIQCSMCDYTMYRPPGGPTSNALLHLKNHHPEAMERAQQEGGREEEEAVENAKEEDGAAAEDFEFDYSYDETLPDIQRRKRRKTSVVWRFFKKHRELSLIKCTLCDYQARLGACGTTSQALLHLKNHHQEELWKEQDNEDVKEEEEEGDNEEELEEGDTAGKVDSFKQRRGQRSPVWRFFDKLSAETASCKECGQEIGTKFSTTTGLIKHLRSKHEELFREFEEAKEAAAAAALAEREKEAGEEGKEGGEEEDGEEKSWVWRERKSIIYSFFTQVNPVQMRCNCCGKLLVRSHGGSTSGCLNHLKRFHPEEIPDESSGPRIPESEKEDAEAHFEALCGDGGGGQLRCRECGVTVDVSAADKYQRGEILYEHLKENHATMVVKVRRPKKNYYVKKDDRRRQNRSLVWDYFTRAEEGAISSCNLCKRTLELTKQNTTNMRNHLRAHHKEEHSELLAKELLRAQEMEAYAESQELSEEDRERLRRRLATGADDTERRTCPECGKCYSSRQAMTYHRKVVHSGARPFKCDKCEATFARVDSHRAHAAICGIDPSERQGRGGDADGAAFLCSVCGKTFARQSARNVHEKSHGERRFVCSFDDCGKRFPTKQRLQIHERVHTGEKPYQCSECGKGFAKGDQLKSHFRIHTGEKPFSCDRCGQTFRHYSTRNKHRCDRPAAGGEGAGAPAARAVAAAAVAAAVPLEENMARLIHQAAYR